MAGEKLNREREVYLGSGEGRNKMTEDLLEKSWYVWRGKTDAADERQTNLPNYS